MIALPTILLTVDAFALAELPSNVLAWAAVVVNAGLLFRAAQHEGREGADRNCHDRSIITGVQRNHA